MGRTPLTIGAVALALAVPLILGSATQASAASAADDVTISPTIHTSHVPVAAEIGATVAGGVLTSVTVTDARGRTVAGALRADGSGWMPAENLAYDHRYTATLVATDGTGAAKTITTSFTTMSKPTGRPISTSVNVTNKSTYGVAMPITLTFSTDVPTTDRASIERRLFVQSSPAQMGIWSWQSASQVVYRPQTYWQSGSSITLDTDISGLAIGNRPITGDHSATFRIGKDLEYTANTKTHYLTITSDGEIIHKYPLSAGKPSTPSWTGHFVIMSKQYYTVFNTIGIPGENYITAVHYAERLTNTGTFFHSAPWSVGEQGHTNVSHGCINLAPSNAAWIYHHGQVGDPVAITGTPIHAAQGNGWTMWDMSWAKFVQGSAVGFAQSATVPGATPAI
jgi:lipoprotein-anchoring transpeptidase ErfK/SrfK